jgi:molybdopterin/thiamine biosynthesis adenylyltransferase
VATKCYALLKSVVVAAPYRKETHSEQNMQNELTDSELETYSRQVVLSDIGYDGQVRLKNSKVCIIGVGGLGAPSALKLAGMGVGYLRLVDRDIVSRSDLHRQYLYSANAIGRPKVEVACEKLGGLNPDVTLDPIPESLNSLNAEALIGGMDVVIDGLDRPEPRYLVNRICNKLGVPYIFGAAIEAAGNVSTLLPGQTFCLECFMDGLKDEDLPVCGVVGVHPSILGIVSSVQIFEAIRVLTGQQPKLFNKLFYIDLRAFEFNLLDIHALDTCKVCGPKATGPPGILEDRFFEETCARDGKRNFVLSPRARIEIDLERLELLLKQKDLRIKFAGQLGTTFDVSRKITACILKSGIMNAQAPPELAQGVRQQIYDFYTSLLVDDLGFNHKLLPELPSE